MLWDDTLIGSTSYHIYYISGYILNDNTTLYEIGSAGPSGLIVFRKLHFFRIVLSTNHPGCAHVSVSCLVSSVSIFLFW